MRGTSSRLEGRDAGSVAAKLRPTSPRTNRPELHDGSRVAVVGGGPAGSFFAYFLLETAERAGLHLDVTVFEHRDFARPGPAGCNMCGGVLSESMVQVLATEGIRIPRSVAQRGLDSYVIHSPDGRVFMDIPLKERRITAMHRGSGPKNARYHDWESFDGFLLEHAAARGARVLKQRVKAVSLEDGHPYVETAEGRSGPYDLLAGCTGVNSPTTRAFSELDIGFSPPIAGKAYVAELYVGKEWIDAHYGSTMHVFMLSIPGLEFGGLLPKGRHVTLVLVGEDIGDELVDRFLSHPEVRRCLPPGWTNEMSDCSCRPKMSIKGVPVPYADRFVFLGDAGVTRLYKDGIGAAYRGAKAAAVTAVFDGVSSDCFAGHFNRTCEVMRRDNRYGRFVFWAAGVVQAMPPVRRGMLRMVADEQLRRDGARRRMSEVLWDTFTGSAPYRQVFVRTLHPAYLGGLLWRSALGLSAPQEER